MPNRYLGQDPILTNLSLAYSNDTYIADQVLPFFNVSTQSGKGWVFDRARFRTSKNSGVRAPGANSEEVRLAFALGSPYFAEDHAKKIFVSDEDRDNARATGRDPFADATEHVTEMQMVDREVEAATYLTTDANYASANIETLTGSARWNDYANSDPIEDVRAGISTVHSKLFVDVNTVVLPRPVFDVLQDHPSFLERVKYSQLGVLTAELLARVWGVNRVIVPGAGVNSSTAGQADSMEYIWGKSVELLHVNASQADKTLTFARTYRWKSPIVQRLRGTDEEDRRGTYVRRGDHYYDIQEVSDEAGFLIKTVID